MAENQGMTLDLNSLQLSQNAQNDSSTHGAVSDISKKLNAEPTMNLDTISGNTQDSKSEVAPVVPVPTKVNNVESNNNMQPEKPSTVSKDLNTQNIPVEGQKSSASLEQHSLKQTSQPTQQNIQQPVQNITEHSALQPHNDLELNQVAIKAENPTQPKKIILGDSMEEEREKEAKEGFKLEKLEQSSLQEFGQQETKKVVLGNSGVGIKISGKSFEFSYIKILTWSLLIMVVFGLSAIGMFVYEKYLRIASEPVVPAQYNTYIQKYQKMESFVNNYIPISQYNTYKDLLFVNNTKNLQEILFSNDLNYIQKKRIIQENIDKISTSILTSHKKIDTAKQGITKYGFLSQELEDILQNQQSITSIQRSLLSLEIIKFSSAIKVFSYLDTFLNNLSDTLGLSQSLIQRKMDELIQRGEKDVLVYLNNCYLNPYEVNYDCEVISDFDHYYQFVTPDDRIDTSFFKKLMYFIDLQLEQTELPSFSIVFKKFDPSKEEITFTLDVNTFQKDEASLIQKGVLNPHIFVVTQLINFLKQSKFIVGENIDVKQLKIQPRVVKIGATHFTVNNSVMTFTLPIQKATEREIFDFVDIIRTQKVLSPTNDVIYNQKTEFIEPQELVPPTTSSSNTTKKAVILGNDNQKIENSNLSDSPVETLLDTDSSSTDVLQKSDLETGQESNQGDNQESNTIPTYEELEAEAQQENKTILKPLTW